MSGEQTTMAIAFADVRGSTAIYESVGDVRGRQMTAAAVDGFCRAVENHGGRIVKTMGDGAMVILPTAEAALLAAVTTQEQQNTAAVKLGIGFQYGSVLCEKDDVFGDAVNVAARLCSLAKAGEILTTAETASHFPAMLRSMTRHIDTTAVRGRREPVDIHQVTWEAAADATMTVVAKPDSTARKRRRTLTLTFGTAQLRFDATSEPLRLGRLQADLEVPDTLASRQHAVIENWRGKFMLGDQSTNGTFVLFDHGATTELKRESGELSESGYIGLGRPPAADNPHRIRFIVDPGDEG